MTPTSASNPVMNRPVLWRPVVGLAGLQGAISLAWVLYRFYLPQLLATVGLPGVDRVLLIVEDGLAALLEPTIGGLSDRARWRVGSRYPFVVAGVLLTVLMFGVMGAAALGRGAIVQTLLVISLLVWAVAMAVFRSPAIALLGQYALQSQLPQANSLLVLSAGVVGAVAPLARDRILAAGPAYAFGLGSLVLIGAAAVLWLAGPDRVLGASAVVQAPRSPIRWATAVRLFGLGAAIGWGLRLFLGIVPGALQAQLPQVAGPAVGLGLGLAVALLAVLLGAVAGRVGNGRLMLAGAIALALGLPLLTLAPVGAIAWPLILLVVVAWAGLFNGGIPLAIELMPDRVGLGIGCFFGGFSAASALLSEIGLSVQSWNSFSSFAIVILWLIAPPMQESPIGPLDCAEDPNQAGIQHHSEPSAHETDGEQLTRDDGPRD